jgi:hypothetical protein
MMHRAYRTLNDPPKLLAFTALQWLALVGTAAFAIGATKLVGMPAKPAISLCALVLTTVAAIAYSSEPGGVQPVGVCRDLLAMVLQPREYLPGMSQPAAPALGIVILGTRSRDAGPPPVDRADEVFAS